MPVFRRFLSRAVHRARFEPIRVVKSSTPRNGSKWNELLESGSGSSNGCVRGTIFLIIPLPILPKFEKHTEKRCIYSSLDLLLFSTEVSAESIQLLPFIANFLSSPRATKLVFPKTSNSFLNRAPRLIYALIKRGRWFPRASSRR